MRTKVEIGVPGCRPRCHCVRARVCVLGNAYPGEVFVKPGFAGLTVSKPGFMIMSEVKSRGREPWTVYNVLSASPAVFS